MASSSSPSNPNPSFPNGSDPNSIPNTTFVQADPSTFRAVVQRLTGAKLAGKPISGEIGPRRPAFKLHERRPTARKLEIKLGGGGATPQHSHARNYHRGEGAVMASPVSPLELLTARGSPRSPEERAIAEKGYYLHPSPLSTPRGSDPPELLPLFPLHSPTDDYSS